MFIFELIGLILLGFLLILIFIISLIFLFLYLVDTIFGNVFYRFISICRDRIHKKSFNKKSKVRNKIFFKYIRLSENSKNDYLRYNTPLVSFCFSFSAILFIMNIFSDNYGSIKSYIISIIIYTTLYFVGMYRKLGGRKGPNKFLETLDANQEFLKLSFIPITFIVATTGFILGAMGWIDGISNMSLSVENIGNILDDIFYVGTFSNIKGYLINICKLTLLLYVFSLPLQMLEYFTIQIIKYNNRFGKPYLLLIKKIINIVHRL